MRYTRQSIVSNTFFQMPRFLAAGEFAGNKMSNNARFLYTLLFDRHRISVKNGWFDESGEVYIYFKREEMEAQTGLSKVTVLKVMQELKDLLLVEEKKQGLNKPNKIYLLSPVIGNDENPEPYLDPTPDYDPEETPFYGDIDTSLPNVQELNPRTQKNYTAGSIETVPPKVQNLYPNDNKLINNKKIDNQLSDNKGSDTTTAPNGAAEATPPPNGSREVVGIPFEAIKEMYNQTCHMLRSIVSINGKRQAQVTARFKEYGIEGLKTLFERAAQSIFLCGGGAKGWKADFDWLIAPTNTQKVLEGKYDNDNQPIPNANYNPYPDTVQGFSYAPAPDSGVIDVPTNPAHDGQEVVTTTVKAAPAQQAPYSNYRNRNGFNSMGALQQMLAAEQANENNDATGQP